MQQWQLDAIKEVDKAYDYVLKQLTTLKNRYVSEIEDGDVAYENINEDDAVVWFIEGF